MSVAILLPGTGAARAGLQDLGPEAGSAEETVYSPTFADVPDDHAFSSPIRALLASGITVGCDRNSTRFCPDAEVTRGQMAAFLVRALRLPAGDTTGFTDDDGHTFETDIERLAAAGITLGCNPPANDRYCPDQAVTRAQMAAFLTRGLPLEVPPAVPPGISLEREPTMQTGVGARLTVCRDQETSLLVRSVLAGSDVDYVRAWQPSSALIPDGGIELRTDRWFLPSAPAGCLTLDLAWDPRANSLSAPLVNTDVKSPFGPRLHPILGIVRLHSGIDLAADEGDQVFAAAPGVVTVADTRGGYGLMAEIAHPGGLSTRYAHLSSLDVEPGDPVATGDVVGLVGCTGLCTGPHLHFETLEFGEPVDPLSYLG